MACVETVRCGQVEVRVHRELVMGVSLWPAARPLAEWLTTFGPRGQLLELGCGAGLCALAYAAAGLSLPDSEVAEPSGSTAVLTDGEDAVLELARRNVELNELRDAYVRALDYGPASDADCAALVGASSRCPTVSVALLPQLGRARLNAGWIQKRCTKRLAAAVWSLSAAESCRGHCQPFP
eukprot:TRINITY_DN4614_c0_g1_i2.p1 TRINITY_DN4614_c0_g1~~TRINITY_DN4614_c0_g1_i2.p1  ORF type:complete len:195 (-),score=25.29 TRINITY_DN4614_c0_g1_i2:318-860(-)